MRQDEEFLWGLAHDEGRVNGLTRNAVTQREWSTVFGMMRLRAPFDRRWHDVKWDGRERRHSMGAA